LFPQTKMIKTSGTGAEQEELVRLLSDEQEWNKNKKNDCFRAEYEVF